MSLKQPPTARTQMLIRRPIDIVFESFIDPAITCKFWFSRGSARLEPGKHVTWYWDMHNYAAPVSVKEIQTNRRILIEWPTPVEWTFTARPDHTTFVEISATGFSGTDDEKVSQAIDSMGGFSFVLAGCKAYLEHDIELTLVADHNPDAHVR